MKKLVKEVGLSVLISITAGNGGSEKIREVAKLLSSSAYDRNLEQEADIKAVDYMVKSHVNPEHFANFLFKLSESETSANKYLSWISTHPDSKARAEYIIEYAGKKVKNAQSVLTIITWEKLKDYLKNY
jgi:predicted Zn-dependent protease